MDIFDTKFDYYPAQIWLTRPLGQLTLRQFIEAQKNPKPEIQFVFNRIAEAAAAGDLKLKDELKQKHLYCFTPSVLTDGSGRKLENVKSFTGLMVAEFDKINHSEELKHHIFNKFESCICAYTSPSRKGCKFLFRIKEVESVEEYKDYYNGLASYLFDYQGFDEANGNVVLPLFFSWDKDILVRDNPKVWCGRGEKINSFKVYDGEFETPDDIDEEDEQEAFRIITRGFRKISDNGHIQVRSLSFFLGGLCGSGYTTLDKAQQLLFDLIDDTPYLEKGISNYKKTAQTMLYKGYENPVLLERHKKEIGG